MATPYEPTRPLTPEEEAALLAAGGGAGLGYSGAAPVAPPSAAPAVAAAPPADPAMDEGAPYVAPAPAPVASEYYGGQTSAPVAPTQPYNQPDIVQTYYPATDPGNADLRQVNPDSTTGYSTRETPAFHPTPVATQGNPNTPSGSAYYGAGGRGSYESRMSSGAPVWEETSTPYRPLGGVSTSPSASQNPVRDTYLAREVRESRQPRDTPPGPMNTPKIFGLPSADFVPSQISNEFGWNAISGNDEARRRRYHSTNQPPGAPPEPTYNALSPATLPGPQMNAVDQAGDRLGSAVSGGLTDIYNWANENSPRGDAQAIGDALHAADSPTPTGRDTYLGRVPGSGQETNIIDNAIAGAPGLWDTVSNRWFTPPTSTQPPPTTPTGRDTYLGPAPSTRQEPNVINGLIAGIPGALDAFTKGWITQPDPRYAPKDVPEKTMGPANLGPTAQEATPATGINDLLTSVGLGGVAALGPQIDNAVNSGVRVMSDNSADNRVFGQNPGFFQGLVDWHNANVAKPNQTQTPRPLPETSPWSMEQRFAAPPTYVTDREPHVAQPWGFRQGAKQGVGIPDAFGGLFQGDLTLDGLAGLLSGAGIEIPAVPGTAEPTSTPPATETEALIPGSGRGIGTAKTPASPGAASLAAGETTRQHQSGVSIVWDGKQAVGLVRPDGSVQRWPTDMTPEEAQDAIARAAAMGGASPTTGAAGGQGTGTPTQPTTSQTTSSQPQTTQTNTSTAPVSSNRQTNSSPQSSNSPRSTDTSSRQRGSSVEDMFGDDDDFGLNERDFTEKDYDGDGRISAKDRSVGRKRYQSELSKRRKKKGKTTSFGNVPQREDSPIRTKVLSAIDTSVNKKKRRR